MGLEKSSYLQEQELEEEGEAAGHPDQALEEEEEEELLDRKSVELGAVQT